MPVLVRIEESLDSVPASLGSFSEDSAKGAGGHGTRISLENERLLVTIVPENGAIVSFRDKASGREVVASQTPLVRFFGEVGGEAIEYVSFTLREAEDEGEPAGLALLGFAADRSVSFHLGISLAEGAWHVDARFQAVNRTYAPVQFQSGLTLAAKGSDPVFSTGAWASQSEGTAVLKWDDGALAGISRSSEILKIRRDAESFQLRPRQLDAWACQLAFVPGAADLLIEGDEGAIGKTSDSLIVWVREALVEGKLILGLDDGRTVESPATLYPESEGTFSIEGLGSEISEIALLSQGKEVLRWSRDIELSPLQAHTRPAISDAELSTIRMVGDEPIAALEYMARIPGLRSVANEIKANSLLANDEFESAMERLDEALALRADDATLWWKRSVVAKRLGLDETADLANAHFLAPLEPMLRAEAFLSQPALESGPSAFVAGIAAHPALSMEVAHRLWSMNRLADAVKWLDECLRHRDRPILRLFLAFLNINHGRQAEAAIQVRAAIASGAALELASAFEAEVVRHVSGAFVDLVPSEWSNSAASFGDRD